MLSSYLAPPTPLLPPAGGGSPRPLTPRDERLRERVRWRPPAWLCVKRGEEELEPNKTTAKKRGHRLIYSLSGSGSDTRL